MLAWDDATDSSRRLPSESSVAWRDGGFRVIAGEEARDGDAIEGDFAKAEKTFASEMRYALTLDKETCRFPSFGTMAGDPESS